MEDPERNSTTTSLFLALGLVIDHIAQEPVNDNYNPKIKGFIRNPFSTISRQ
jgi:hypothetical protein